MSLGFDGRKHHEYNSQDPDDKSWENTVEHWEQVMDSMDQFKRKSGGTGKKATHKSNSAAMLTDHMRLAKEEALAKFCAEAILTRHQSEEEGTSLIITLQGQADAKIQYGLKGNKFIQVIIAAQTTNNQALEEMTKQITTLEQQTVQQTMEIAKLKGSMTTSQATQANKEPAASAT